MKFGFCVKPSLVEIASAAGYDYAEWTVTELLKPREPDAVFEENLASIRQAALPYPVANGFLPGDLKVTGPQADLAALEAYVRVVCARAQAAGIQVIVFGSGRARAIPDGYDRDAAWGQLVAFAKMVGPIAVANGVTVVVEPLNRAESNVLNTVAESARLVREVDHPGVRLLVDAFHMLKDGDALDEIVRHGELLVHAHVATLPNRLPPGVEPFDFAPFFAALQQAGYNGRVSVEARVTDPATELPQALPILRGFVRS